MVAERSPVIRCNRPTLARVHFIAGLLRDYQPFTASGIARKLECSRKTVMRDLELMRDRLNWQIEYDQQLGAYQLKGTPPEATI